MLPIYLSIAGLYSYQEKQEIDFSKLTEAGLFGIFGPVGSGKSSILEAISYALYGETERLNKQEKRAYNMLNLKSDQATIDFHFLNFENRKFRFVAQWKRRKRFEETSSIERTAYEWIADQWVPLDSVDGALVTNLSYPNFRRTIIIPQGQFKEFLELKGKERSDMMKEIFLLNQYDLGPNVGILQAENNKKLENIKGALTGFQEVTPEIKEEKELAYQAAKDKLIELKNDLEKHSELHKKLGLAKDNHQDLLNKEAELAKLHEGKKQILQFERDIEEYESVSLHFKEHLNNLHQITTNKEQLLKRIESLQEQKENLRSKIEKNQNNLHHIQNDYESIDTYKREIIEISILIKNSELNQQKEELNARIEKGTPILLQTEKELQYLLSTLEKEEEILEQIKSIQIDTDELLSVGSWYQIADQLDNAIIDLEKRLTINKTEIEQLKQEFVSANLKEDTWEEELQVRWKEIQSRQTEIQEQESNLRLKKELSQYIIDLHDGQACPLCGSEDHPNIMETTDLEEDHKLVEKNKKEWIEAEQAFRQLQAKLNTNYQLIQDKIQQEKTIKEEIAHIENSKNTHNELFLWTNFEIGNRKAFEDQKKLVKQTEALIEKNDLSIRNLRKKAQISRDNVQKFEISLNQLKNQVSIIEARIEQGLSQILILQELSNSKLTKMELTIISNTTQEKIRTVENQYKKWTEELQIDKNVLATVQGQLNETQAQYKTYTSQMQQLQALINNLLIQFKFNDITAVKTILDKTIDSQSIKEKVKQYYLNVNTLSNRINELQTLTKDDNYSPALYEETKALVQEKSKEYEAQISLTGALEKEIQRLIVELDKKLNLISEFEKLNARKENLRTLDNMFKGNGFVNYVSSIHLERLCEIANTRFHRLTKNQLSLCMNEANEFEVKDYLNNGYQRSVKTLSGGQSFQASLCLALALAENIHSLNKADRNFFFLDEGFGTQDAESINTVFDTLQYLHQENRIVGIISHVEDLKEKVPRSIYVTNDIEKGSQISSN